jgi:iron complex outermembrane recepter protein
MGNGRPFQAAQFSSVSPGTFENSFRLLVTRAAPSLKIASCCSATVIARMASTLAISCSEAKAGPTLRAAVPCAIGCGYGYRARCNFSVRELAATCNDGPYNVSAVDRYQARPGVAVVVPQRAGWRRLCAALVTPLITLVRWGVFGMAACSPATAEGLAPPGALPEVVITAPLPGSDLPLNEVPANVQRVTASQFGNGKSRDLSDALNQYVGSVNSNDTQANPFQPDINFRGFTASPILGTPQGVSVFLDGVRVNEAFADALNWDLIPEVALASVEVVPGSNPVFGLNTLGGAIVLTTKRGFDDPGAGAQVRSGSFDRHVLEWDAGGHGARLDYFVAGTVFDEQGWGAHNPSRVQQGFAKVGYRDAGTDVTLALTVADSHLAGNQTLPRSLLADPTQAYTWPDVQQNRMVFLDLNARQRLSEHWTLSGNLYYRQVRTGVRNSNVNGAFDPATPIGVGNEPMGNVIEQIDQYRPGMALQLVGQGTLGTYANTLIAGASVDQGATHFWQYNQSAGSSRDTTSSAPTVLATALQATNRSIGLYGADTLALTERWFLNAAVRFNDAQVTLEDRHGTTLNGQHAFARFNPALGLTFNPTRSLTFYGRIEQGSRVPTPVELSCADPNAPCSLPNAFSGDPPLQSVIAKTAELGARGALGAYSTFTASIFRTALDNDIQFISSGGIGTGYFQNVGRTRRQGVELGAETKTGPFALSAHYTYLEATFQTPLVLMSVDNSAATGIRCATCLEIQVQPGDQIPGMARHLFKARAQYEGAHLGGGLTILGQSGQFARGDENNQDRNGALPGHLLVHLDAYYAWDARWRLSARIDNVFDRRYYTFATLSENVFTAPGNSFDASAMRWRSEQFRSVGAPRGVWLGVAYRVGGPERVP